MASPVEELILEEYNQIQEQIHILDALFIQYYGVQEENIQDGGKPLETQSTMACSVEELILEEYTQIQEQIHSLDALYIQYYGVQEEDIQDGGKPVENKTTEDGEIKTQTTGEEEPEKVEKAKKKSKNKFLARLQKPWKWLTSLNQRGTYVINEEIPGPSHINMVVKMMDSKGNIAADSDQDGESSSKKTNSCKSVQDVRSNHCSPLHNSSIQSSQSRDCQEWKSTTAETSVEEAGASAGASAATVPLSLQCFTLHCILGEGAYGKVLLATDVIRKERVAIKAIDKRDYKELGFNFIERDILQLSHESPYLIHGMAAFHNLNFVFYVMELATRGDLLGFLIDNFPLDIAAVKFITAEVVCGTEFLHKNGILHRDLKLENLLLTTEGHIKITDFGLAVKMPFKRKDDECEGTPGYAAPEMIRGLPYGGEVDFFAIGVILYGLLTSNMPFPGETARDQKLSVLWCPPFYPNTLTPDAVSILKGLLNKDQSQRLGVVGELRRHPFLSDINWADAEAGRMAPPAILTTGSIDLNVEETLDYTELPCYIRSRHQKKFDRFSFVCPEWSQNYHPVIKETETRNWATRLFNCCSCRK